MAPSSFRVLKRHRRITLVESANPAIGLGYSVREGSLGLWSGADRDEAERQFERALGG
jgi:hypothetical protein